MADLMYAVDRAFKVKTSMEEMKALPWTFDSLVQLVVKKLM
jgi:hypothetical protein